jgi:hypothetical protein
VGSGVGGGLSLTEKSNSTALEQGFLSISC